MKNRKEMIRDIEEFTNILKMSSIRSCFEEEAKNALLVELSYEEYLYNLLQRECDLRYENKLQSRLRLAGFPFKKCIEDLEIQYLPEDAKKKLNNLVTLNFMKEGQNVILAGNPGTGYDKFLVMQRFCL